MSSKRFVLSITLRMLVVIAAAVPALAQDPGGQIPPCLPELNCPNMACTLPKMENGCCCCRPGGGAWACVWNNPAQDCPVVQNCPV